MPAASEVGEEVKVIGTRYCPFLCVCIFTDVFTKPRINRNNDVLLKKVYGVGKKSSFPLPRFINKPLQNHSFP